MFPLHPLVFLHHDISFRVTYDGTTVTGVTRDVDTEKGGNWKEHQRSERGCLHKERSPSSTTKTHMGHDRWECGGGPTRESVI